eukprot:17890-Pelagomonas_calceolata.AAC.1
MFAGGISGCCWRLLHVSSVLPFAWMAGAAWPGGAALLLDCGPAGFALDDRGELCLEGMRAPADQEARAAQGLCFEGYGLGLEWAALGRDAGTCRPQEALVTSSTDLVAGCSA